MDGVQTENYNQHKNNSVLLKEINLALDSNQATSTIIKKPVSGVENYREKEIVNRKWTEKQDSIIHIWLIIYIQIKSK